MSKQYSSESGCVAVCTTTSATQCTAYAVHVRGISFASGLQSVRICSEIVAGPVSASSQDGGTPMCFASAKSIGGVCTTSRPSCVTYFNTASSFLVVASFLAMMGLLHYLSGQSALLILVCVFFSIRFVRFSDTSSSFFGNTNPLTLTPFQWV
jgi:hypothetical protein